MEDLFTGELKTWVISYDWSQTPLGAVENWSSDTKEAMQVLVGEMDRAKTSGGNLNPSLYNSQQRYETLLKSMDRGFCISEMLFDAEGRPVDYRFLEANSLFEQMTGLTGAMGNTALGLLPNLEDFWVNTYGNVVLNGESVQFEHEAKSLNRWFEVNAFPIDAPREFRFGVIFTDITARRDAEIHLSLIQERLEISLAAGDVGVWDLDLVSNQAWRSIEHDRIFGYDDLLPDWNYENFLSHVIPEDRDPIDQEFKAAIANHTSWETECGIRTVNGELRWIWSKASTEYNQNNEPVRMYGVVRDISDRHREEQNNKFLVEIQKDLTGIKDFNQMLNVVGEKIRTWFGFWLLAFSDVDPEAYSCTTFHTSSEDGSFPQVAEYSLIDFFSENHLQKLQAGEIVAIDDVYADPEIKDRGDVYKVYGVHSLLNISSVSDGKWKFLISGNRRKPSIWRKDEIDLMSELLPRIYLEIERSRSEAALEKVNQRFEAAMQAVDGIIFEWKMDNNFVFRSNGLFGLVGVKVEDAPPTFDWWFNLIHPEDQPKIESFFAQIEFTHDRYQLEYRVRHTDGRWVDVWEKGNLKRNAVGKLVQVIGFTSDISDRKYAERKLRESEKLYRAIGETIDYGIWICEPNGQNSYASNSFLKLLGITQAECSGLDWSKALHPDDGDGTVRAWLECVRTGGKWDREHRFMGADGNWHPVLARGIPVKNDRGEIISWAGINLDISNLKQTEAQLRQSEERLRLAVEGTHMGTWDLDLQTDKLIWSEQNFRLLGYEPSATGEATHEMVASCIHPDDKEIVHQRWMQALQGHSQFHSEHRMMRADNQQKIWVENLGSFIYDDAGQAVRATGVVFDISDRKLAEAILSQSEERYRYLAESIPQLIWTSNSEGRLLDVNQRWLDYTSITLVQVQIHGWELVVHPEDIPILSQHWDFAQKNGTFYQAEGRMRRRDGVYRWHLHQAISMKNERGQIIKWFGTATDIEDQKQLEQEYFTLLKQLQERNQELDRFSYIVSHDLKAPLRAIANLAQWVEEDVSDLIPPENQQQLQLMRSRVYRMEGLINGLLNYARIGREEISSDLVSIPELLSEILDSLAPPSTFTIEIASALPTFSTKRILLSQVLFNLIGNAIKHHDRPDGKITVSVQEYTESPEFYEFVITDDGKGIDPDQQKRIFDIFQTVEGQNHSDSTGIGLAIVKKIVETEGGKIQLKSEVGRGSTFSFTWRKYSDPSEAV